MTGDTEQQAPADEPMWLIYFEDADVRPEIFAGPNAEKGARARLGRARDNWACHLFVAASDPAAPTEQPTPGLDWDAASRKMIEQATEDHGTPLMDELLDRLGGGPAPPGSDAELIADLERRLLAAIRERDHLRGMGPLPDQTWQEELDAALEQLAAAQAHSRLLDDQLRRTQGYEADMAGEIAALKQRLEAELTDADLCILRDYIGTLLGCENDSGWQVRGFQWAKQIAKRAAALAAEPPVRKCICEVPPQGLPRMADPDCPLHGDPAIIGEPPGGQQEQGHG